MNQINLSDPIPDRSTFDLLYRSAVGVFPNPWAYDMVTPGTTTYGDTFRLLAYVTFYGAPDDWNAVKQATGVVFNPNQFNTGRVMESIAKHEPAVVVDVHGFYVVLSGGSLRLGV